MEQTTTAPKRGPGRPRKEKVRKWANRSISAHFDTPTDIERDGLPVLAGELPVYGGLSEELKQGLAPAADALADEQERRARNLRQLAAVRHSFPKGNKQSRRYGFDDCAMVVALRSLGVGWKGIGKVFQSITGAYPGYETLNGMATGERYADIRAQFSFPDRVGHFIDYFGPMYRMNSAWRPGPDSVAEAKAARTGEPRAARQVAPAAPVELDRNLNAARMAEAARKRQAARAAQ